MLALLIVVFCLPFFGFGDFAASWRVFINGSTWIPFSPYVNRIEDASKLKRLDGTKVVFEDMALFWKGYGAVVVPHLTKGDELQNLKIASGGSGYGSNVKATVVGAGANQFELGEVTVRDGRIVAVEIIRVGTWYHSSKVFCDDEVLPFSGTSQIKYQNGQIMESRKYLEGELHGTWSKWKRNGIPLFDKEYVRGLRHGSHMYWTGQTIDPKDYDPRAEETDFTSLWSEVNEQAKDKFNGNHPSQESNDWVIDEYGSQGGVIGPKLQENWKRNKLHGVVKGFDSRGEKTFEDEFASGKRIKHKSYDPGMKWKLPTHLSTWAD